LQAGVAGSIPAGSIAATPDGHGEWRSCLGPTAAVVFEDIAEVIALMRPN
jgi:hypothetical protein